ncbi:hypothetical protein PIB30_025433 [Stylosanthes scabra]|uniref:PB1-like domain-containing protein n=1 Tax=Stylosanthes scabra TaxID=79078 RepID=A0ABU6TAA2_9FABA|nr:hypothetical protein [Stylosanthes scabra]
MTLTEVATQSDGAVTEVLLDEVIHVGGQLREDENRVLSYMDGEVHTFDLVNPMTLCIANIEGMAMSLGFATYTSMHWLEPLAQNLEFGLRELNGVADLNELRGRIMETQCVDFEVFFEHSISEPIVEECVNLDSDDGSKSNSHDSYESAEDEAYKPPPEGYELSSDSDSEKRKKVTKKNERTKTPMTPTKKGSPKKAGRKKIPIKPVKNENGPQEDVVQETDGGQQSPKKSSRKYAGKRRAKSRPNFGPSSSGSGPNSRPSSSGSQPKSNTGVGSGNMGSNGSPNVEPIIEEVDSDEGKGYVYESEEFLSPISSDEDGVNRHK